MSVAPSEKKKKKRPSFSHSRLEVDISQFPGISGQSSTTIRVHVSACACSVHLPHLLTQETWASAKVYLVLEKCEPWREHCHSHCCPCLQPWTLHWCWLRTRGRIITGPQALEFFSNGSESHCVRIKKKDKGRRGKLLPTLLSTWMTFIEAIERNNLLDIDYWISCYF